MIGFQSGAFQFGAFQQLAPVTSRKAGGGSGRRRPYYFVTHNAEPEEQRPETKPEKPAVKIKRAGPDYVVPAFVPTAYDALALLPHMLSSVDLDAQTQALADLHLLAAQRSIVAARDMERRKQQEEEEFLRMVMEII